MDCKEKKIAKRFVSGSEFQNKQSKEENEHRLSLTVPHVILGVMIWALLLGLPASRASVLARTPCASRSRTTGVEKEWGRGPRCEDTRQDVRTLARM